MATVLSFFRKHPDGYRRGTTRIASLEIALENEGYTRKLVRVHEFIYTHKEKPNFTIHIHHRFGAQGRPYAWMIENETA